MFEFNRTFSGLVRERTGRINQIFGGRYKWSLVKDDRYLSTVYRYIYRNPCDAGLVSKAEDYRYSTLYPTAVFPFDLVNLIEATQEEQIRFFNEDPRENERINISKGMRKKYFSAPVERSSRKQYQLPTLAC